MPFPPHGHMEHSSSLIVISQILWFSISNEKPKDIPAARRNPNLFTYCKVDLQAVLAPSIWWWQHPPRDKTIVTCSKHRKCASACPPLAGLHTAPADNYGNIPMDYHRCRRRALYSETSLPPLCPKPFTEVLYCFMTVQLALDINL